MADLRFCTVCESAIDLDECNVMHESEITTATGQDGRPHFLLSRRRSAARLRGKKNIEVATIIVPKTEAPAVPAAQAPGPPSTPIDMNLANTNESTPVLTEVAEKFVPSPEDWYSGTIQSNDQRFRHLAALLSNGQRVMVLYRDLKCPGKHQCLLKPSMKIALRLDLTRRDRYDFQALEGRVEGDFEPCEETSVVKYWSPTCKYGSLERPCGCDILGLGPTEEPLLYLKEGDVVRHQTLNSAKGWKADNLEVWSKEHQ